METLQAYAKEASQYALKLLGETPLATMTAQMSEELYHSIELRASPVRYARSAASSQRPVQKFPTEQWGLQTARSSVAANTSMSDCAQCKSNGHTCYRMLNRPAPPS